MDTDNKNQNDITSTEKDTLHNAGVDFPANTSPILKDEEEKQEVVDIDNGASSLNELADMGIDFVKEEKREDVSNLKPETASPAPAYFPGGKDLENEFKNTVGNIASPEKDSFGQKISSLQVMLNKIKEKLGFKKAEVKQEIENLKKAKEEIAKDIENIKELEESEQKIQEELKKVESIKEKITDIEKEVEKELSS
ncbi:MAG: hypothetical protein QG580_467 [Patescibacteria group bacterium]|jgi:DNA repair exonuclease SbcCD ATPase subunit|nr:hypothetical protein [Patescibacteria group bacterium]